MEKSLIEAAAGGDTKKALSLLQNGSDIDMRDEAGTTALMEAAKYGHLDLATVLLDHGADVNAQQRVGITALMLAAAHGHSAIVVLLADWGAQIDAVDKQGSTALMWASAWGQPDCVQALLENSAGVNWTRADGTTPLMRAAKYRKINVLRILVNHGAEVNAQDGNGTTPLMWASVTGDSGIVQELVQAGAQVDQCDRDGTTALIRAAAKGHCDSVSILLAAGADPYAKDKRGRTPLSLSAVSGHEEVVRGLLEWQRSHPGQGRLELQIDDHGDTPLMLAARTGQIGVVRLLLDSMEGSLSSDDDEILLDRHLNGRNKKGDTALIEAIRTGHVEITRLLLGSGADPNTKNLKCQTAIMEAVLAIDCSLVDLLLDKGADPFLSNARGETAFDLVRQNQYSAMHMILEKLQQRAHTSESGKMTEGWPQPLIAEEGATWSLDPNQDLEIHDDQIELDGSTDECGSRSNVMRAAFAKARLASDSDSAILLLGESGTGKDFMARYIHDHSMKASGPFRAVNCAALPREMAESALFGHEKGAFTGATAQIRGIFELAQSGTVFLNEIGDMPLALQSKLLTFLDTHRFQRVGGEKEIASDARIIAATNKDLKREVAAKSFRLDLYHRLAVWVIKVPPLRERIEDIPLLARNLLSDLWTKPDCNPPDISQPALQKLCSYRWEGNVRQLKNTLQRALILSRGNIIESEHILFDQSDEAPDPQQNPWPRLLLPQRLPDNVLPSPLKRQAMANSGAERSPRPEKPTLQALRSAYETFIVRQGWPRARLAEHFGVDSSTLKKWFKEAGLPAGQAGRPKKNRAD
jgi:DNA-binding NtrC family response regulator/ankyrin repeat protein